ncbi:hypothetical protein L596_011796 [Steinernema carpocapsae]|uniref:Fungal lipase-type domain-containing protein n=1 Tax=Steinernema carpocapsae TaxID=34508 RepID=A0A4U5NW00_STECR|nr:hypothetical protein L596_011796 [Steinernema carpocapsae]
MLLSAALLVTLLGLSQAVPETPIYNEALARDKFYVMAAAAFRKDATKCVQNTFSNATLIRQLSVVCDTDKKDDTCSAFIVVAHSEKAIILSFRGTTNIPQLVLEVVETIGKRLPYVGGGTVSRYFLNGFDDIWHGGMKDDFLAARKQYPNYEVWVTGHSLGAALASLAGEFLVREGFVPDAQLKLITFGQPRVGDKAYSNSHDAQVTYSFRVVHYLDIVPHLPPRNFEKYFHHRYEVWYNNNMARGSKYKVCGDDSDSCSDSKLPNMFGQDHLIYYNTKVQTIEESDCVTKP